MTGDQSLCSSGDGWHRLWQEKLCIFKGLQTYEIYISVCSVPTLQQSANLQVCQVVRLCFSAWGRAAADSVLTCMLGVMVMRARSAPQGKTCPEAAHDQRRNKRGDREPLIQHVWGGPRQPCWCGQLAAAQLHAGPSQGRTPPQAHPCVAFDSALKATDY